MTRANTTAALSIVLALSLPATASAAKHPTLKQQIHVLRAKLAHEQRVVKNLRTQLAQAKQAAPINLPAITPAAVEPAAPPPTLPVVLPPEPAGTPQTDHAVNVIRDEVDYTAGVLAANGINTTREELTGRAILSYVTGHISAPLYGYGIHPDWTAENALFAGSGICGNAALVYAELARRLGLPVRSVQFYYGTQGDNHIADEIFYAGGWHYFDPTFGLYYTDASGAILSIDAARALTDPAAALHYDSTLLWTTVAQQAGITSLIDFATETAPSTRVDIGAAFS